MIVQILVAQCQPDHPLADQTFHGVLDQLRVPKITKTGRELTQQPSPPLDLSQQQPSAI